MGRYEDTCAGERGLGGWSFNHLWPDKYCSYCRVSISHRRRIYTEEKAKVVAAVWES